MTWRPAACPAATIASASLRACAGVFMNAPEPTLTSSTSASTPSASFFERIDAVMSGIDSTVAVTSRSEYSFLSAGTRRSVWPMSDTPISAIIFWKSARDRRTSKPGIDSSLSSVPPVWPRPRPEIIGTATPHAATAGARGIETLSPTPPVECLSAVGWPRPCHVTMSPECCMAPSSAAVSTGVMPRK